MMRLKPTPFRFASLVAAALLAPAAAHASGWQVTVEFGEKVSEFRLTGRVERGREPPKLAARGVTSATWVETRLTADHARQLDEMVREAQAEGAGGRNPASAGCSRAQVEIQNGGRAVRLCLADLESRPKTRALVDVLAVVAPR